MIAPLLVTLAVNQAVVVDARPTADADRVYGTDIQLRCGLSVNGRTVDFVVGLEGEIGGGGKGPLILAEPSPNIQKFKSVSSMVGWDEKVPLGSRAIDVTLDSTVNIDNEKYVAKMGFQYSQDDVAPNKLYRPDRIIGTKLALFRARDMRQGYIGYLERNSTVRPVTQADCVASSRSSGIGRSSK